MGTDRGCHYLRLKDSFSLTRIEPAFRLRRVIEKQLGKIELANSFTRVVADGNPRGIEPACRFRQGRIVSCACEAAIVRHRQVG